MITSALVQSHREPPGWYRTRYILIGFSSVRPGLPVWTTWYMDDREVFGLAVSGWRALFYRRSDHALELLRVQELALRLLTEGR